MYLHGWGQFLDVRDGDQVYAWHVSGKVGGNSGQSLWIGELSVFKPCWRKSRNRHVDSRSTQGRAHRLLTSILTQVQTLQTDREKLMKELELAKQKVEKLTEGKRAEMKTALDTVVAKRLEDSVADEAIMSRLMIQLRIRVCGKWSCAPLQLTRGGSTRWRSCGQSTRSSRRA